MNLGQVLGQSGLTNHLNNSTTSSLISMSKGMKQFKVNNKINKNQLNKNIHSILNIKSSINKVDIIHKKLIDTKKAHIISKLNNCRIEFLKNYYIIIHNKIIEVDKNNNFRLNKYTHDHVTAPSKRIMLSDIFIKLLEIILERWMKSKKLVKYIIEIYGRDLQEALNFLEHIDIHKYQSHFITPTTIFQDCIKILTQHMENQILENSEYLRL